MKTVHVVNWRRDYSEYGYCYISESLEDAQEVADKLTQAYADDLYGVEFSVEEERIGYIKELL